MLAHHEFESGFGRLGRIEIKLPTEMAGEAAVLDALAIDKLAERLGIVSAEREDLIFKLGQIVLVAERIGQRLGGRGESTGKRRRAVAQEFEQVSKVLGTLAPVVPLLGVVVAARSKRPARRGLVHQLSPLRIQTDRLAAHLFASWQLHGEQVASGSREPCLQIGENRRIGRTRQMLGKLVDNGLRVVQLGGKLAKRVCRVAKGGRLAERRKLMGDRSKLIVKIACSIARPGSKQAKNRAGFLDPLANLVRRFGWIRGIKLSLGVIEQAQGGCAKEAGRIAGGFNRVIDHSIMILKRCSPWRWRCGE